MTAAHIAYALVTAAPMAATGAGAYWLACQRHARALRHAAEQVAALQTEADGSKALAEALTAQVGELIAAMTAMPPSEHRQQCAEYRAKYVERLTQQAKSTYRSETNEALARVYDPDQPNRPRRQTRSKAA